MARVGKAYEKTTESSEESEVMAKKVGPGTPGAGGRWCQASGRRGTPPLLPPFPAQCSVLKEKLDSLLKTLDDESQASSSLPMPPPTIAEEAEDGDGAGGSCSSSSTGARAVGSACSARPQVFRPREQLMLRANSLKKAIRQIIEHTEKGSWARAPAWGAGVGTLGERRGPATQARATPDRLTRASTPSSGPVPDGETLSERRRHGGTRLVEGPAHCLHRGPSPPREGLTCPLPVGASPAHSPWGPHLSTPHGGLTCPLPVGA